MGMLTRATAATLTVFCLAIPVHAQSRGSNSPDVVYGHKDGMALTFDVLKPASNSNGAGVLYIESGGWRSSWRPIEQSRSRFDMLLSKGFTVFVVRHGSAPRYNAHEAYGDLQRAVRFVRLHAQTYGVDPDRLGVHGASAGGHLSLMLGLASDTGDPSAEDEVLRGSSQVAAVVAYYPEVDMRPQSQSYGDFPPLTTEAYFYGNGLAVVPRRRVANPCCDTVHGALERWACAGPRGDRRRQHLTDLVCIVRRSADAAHSRRRRYHRRSERQPDDARCAHEEPRRDGPRGHRGRWSLLANPRAAHARHRRAGRLV